MRWYKFPGSSLLYSLIFMTVIISITVMFFVFFDINTNILNHQKKAAQVNAIGMMGLSQLLTVHSDTTINISYNGYDCAFERQTWGGFNICYLCVKGNDQDTFLAKAYLTGKAKDNNKVSLVLRSSHLTLRIGANVFLDNECYVPEGFFRPYGNTGTRDYRISGKLRNSEDTLPHIFNIASIQKQRSKLELSHSSTLKTITDSIYNSYKESPLVLSSDTLYVTGKLRGRIILEGRQIFISADANIEDAIIFAEDIHIADKFTGSLQMFASDSIIIGRDVHLKYPSIVAVLPENAHRPGLVIGKQARIAGEVYAYSSDETVNKRMHVSVQDSAKIVGGIITKGSLQFRGTCYGTIICDHTVDNIYGNTQENLLFSARISVDSLPGYYTYTNLFPFSKKGKVVSKLY